MSLYLNCFVSNLIAHELVRELIFFFGLGLSINKPKTKVQVWLIFKQINMNQLFIESSSSCS